MLHSAFPTSVHSISCIYTNYTSDDETPATASGGWGGGAWRVAAQHACIVTGSLVLGSTTVLQWNCGTSFSRYQYRRDHGTTVVPQYHKYRGTTVRYLPTNSHFSEDFRAKKNSLLTG